MNEEAISDLLSSAAGSSPDRLSPEQWGTIAHRGRRRAAIRRTAAVVSLGMAAIAGSLAVVNLRSGSTTSLSSAAAGSSGCVANATPTPDTKNNVDYSGGASQRANGNGRAPMTSDEAVKAAKDRFLSPEAGDPVRVQSTVTEKAYTDAAHAFGLPESPEVAGSRCVWVVTVAGPAAASTQKQTASFTTVFDEQSGQLLGFTNEG